MAKQHSSYNCYQAPSVYLDLEQPQDLAKVENATDYFEYHGDKLIILNEIQHKPEIFAILGLLQQS